MDRMIFFSEASLRHAVAEYIEHYHAERPHQGIDNVVLSLPNSMAITRATGRSFATNESEDYSIPTTARMLPENQIDDA
jgi:hypothetical protein